MIIGNRKTCLCCAKPLTELQALTESLCGSAACAWKFRTVGDAEKCVICSRVLNVTEFAQRTCADRECRRAWLVERPLAAKRKQHQILFAKAIALRDEQAAINHLDAEAFEVTLVPYNYAAEYEPPLSRRELLREHLLRVVHEAIEFPDGLPPRGADEPAPPPLFDVSPLADSPSPELGAVLLHACIGCRGYCCRTGGEHAFITPQTIRRFVATNGLMTVEQVIELYMSYLVPRTMESGCIYQHKDGCVLPHAMRSDTCNRYYCNALREYRFKYETSDAPFAFFVPSDERNVESGTFVAPGFVKIVRKSVEQ